MKVGTSFTISDVTCNGLIVKATGDVVGGCVGQTESNSSFTDITCDDVNVEGNGYVGCAFGALKNSTLTTCNITDSIASSTSWKAGGCAGQAEGGAKLSGVVCQNLQVKGGTNYIGGCIGQTYGNCEFSDILCDSVVVEGGGEGLGGMMGYCINSTKNNCRVINSRIGNNSSGSPYRGGFAGQAGASYQDTSTTNCFVRNTDVLSTGWQVGGFFGQANSVNDVSSCYVEDCRITGSRNSGGFSGSLAGTSTLNSCHVASVTMDTSGDYIGGFVGCSESSITSCYVASISLDTSGDYIGGLVGCSSGSCSITSCYSEDAKIKATSHSVGGLVGYLKVDGSITQSHVKKAKIEIDAIENRQCYGGLVGQSSGTISLCYVDDSDIDSFQQVGGLVGFCPGGSISKSFVRNTRINGYDLDIGGLVATVMPDAQVDSCYVKNCNISCTVEMNALDHTIGGLVGSNFGDITNSYVYNSTVTGKTGYGALVGQNGAVGLVTNLSNNFISQNYSILVDSNQNSTPLTSCYYNVGDLANFKSKTWTDGKTIEGGSTAWSNFNTTSFPPQLADLSEPPQP